MYHAVGERDPMLAGVRSPTSKHPSGSGSVRSMRLETPAAKCNDALFAVIFIVHLIVIGVFGFWKGVPALKEQMAKQTTRPEEANKDFRMVFGVGSALMGIGLVLAGAWMKVLMAYAESMIRISLWLNVGLVVGFAFATFAVNPIASFVFLFLAALNVCYIFAVQNRIGFATANLKAACAAVSKYSSIFFIALMLVVIQFVWLLLWSLGSIGVYQLFKESDPNCQMLGETDDGFNRGRHMCGGAGAGVAFFFLLVSVYWGQQVLQNILTCTTAGVVASWWYHPSPQNVASGALYRSMTTSFGSICLGSLLVAIVQALRTLARMLREKAQEEDNAALACVACLFECILNCIESILEYINMWAYVYVGIYGYDFRTSGKAVMDLFANRGWTAVINDDLTSSALTIGALGVGVVTCCIGLFITSVCPAEYFAALGSKQAGYAVMAVIGFIAGMSMAMILANVVISALHTVFVCFAEDPIAFSRNHPREYEDLVMGWRQFHNDDLVNAYGAAV